MLNVLEFLEPKVSVLSATEEVLDSMPSSIDAKELTKRAKEEGIDADVYGPMAFDNSVSENAAKIKGIKNAVAGKTDILLVPNVETGNGLVKMMIFFMGACAAGVVVGGKVPVVITSRADDTQARLASMAADCCCSLMNKLKNWDNNTWLSSKNYINNYCKFIKSKVKINKHTKLLDIGCGRANIISFLHKKIKFYERPLG